VGRTKDHRPILDHWDYSWTDCNQHTEAEMKQGMLEYWNIGILVSNAGGFFTHHSIIPSFHFSKIAS
jgi:hypothetical protein